MDRVPLADFLASLPPTEAGGPALNAAQLAVVAGSGGGPGWVIAGPGTGKTHTLAWLALKRLLVDGVRPERLVLTTFTRKAAAELRVRLAHNLHELRVAGVAGAAGVELARLNLGTLHALCAGLLQRHRFAPTHRMRVLEGDVAQRFFVQRSGNALLGVLEERFWKLFDLTRDERLPDGSRVAAAGCVRRPENVAARAEGACVLFNRLSEDLITPEALRAGARGAEAWAFGVLADAYAEYLSALAAAHFTDQSWLQRHFLAFLRSEEGAAWVGGGLCVIVDEYQDTNAIQEEVYGRLAGEGADLTVVGDDDQALYRFRNATVEALTEFDARCRDRWGRTPSRVDLHENYRSHAGIVRFVSDFVTDHPELRGARAPLKRELVARSALGGEYAAVRTVIEPSAELAAARLAGRVVELIGRGFVRDASQVALLGYSVRERAARRAVLPYLQALRAAGVACHNPRGSEAQSDPVVLAVLGALSYLIDANFQPGAWRELPAELTAYVLRARRECRDLLQGGSAPGLRGYLRASLDHLGSLEDGRLLREDGQTVTLLGLLFKLMAFEPFAGLVFHEVHGERLRALHALLAAYCTHYRDGELRKAGGGVQREDLADFYGVFVAGVYAKLQDPADEEQGVVPGCVNVLTVHQAKGMEFEVVCFVNPDHQPGPSSAHTLEARLGRLGARGGRALRPPRERAAQDAVRQLFVAYSRAKRLLVLAGQWEEDPYSLERWNRALARRGVSGDLGSLHDLRRLGLEAL